MALPDVPPFTKLLGVNVLHRTAERTGLQTGHPVIAVSHSMSIINLYFGGRRHVVADPPTILGVIGVLTAVAVAATLAPALRAIRVDPMAALRSE